jgi:hypothetical protein
VRWRPRRPRRTRRPRRKPPSAPWPSERLKSDRARKCAGEHKRTHVAASQRRGEKRAQDARKHTMANIIIHILVIIVYNNLHLQVNFMFKRTIQIIYHHYRMH